MIWTSNQSNKDASIFPVPVLGVRAERKGLRPSQSHLLAARLRFFPLQLNLKMGSKPNGEAGSGDAHWRDGGAEQSQGSVAGTPFQSVKRRMANKKISRVRALLSSTSRRMLRACLKIQREACF